MTDAAACGRACQFIRPDYAGAEARVHGRPAGTAGDEGFFGVHRAIYRARIRVPAEGAQCTGITTRLAAELLRPLPNILNAVVDAIPVTNRRRDNENGLLMVSPNKSV